jgi:hypothetical protein
VQKGGTAGGQKADFHFQMWARDQRILAAPILDRSVNAPEFIAQIVTIGFDERTISTDGCSLRRILLIALESSVANALASSGATSAA